ncbi:putative disease resistance protein At1g61300 [Bidens hawaiensis]|uniref:putative disease resistance protein At1g61300 n=1 Tax=Bidens hawaiensis TaxID=980011 RepID=UPI00404A5231
MTEVVSALVGKVVDYLCGAAKTEITYLWNYSENVKNLKNEIEKLSSMKGRVQQHIELATSKGECILKGVEEWIKKVDAEISDATEFIAKEAEAKKTCLKLPFCVNLSTILQFSKTATKRTSYLQQHQRYGKDFETCVSLPAPTPGFLDLYRRKSLENIDTQKSTLKKIIEAIKDDKIQIVGINGLGGVGKTTLASEVAAEMKNEFAEIVFVTVSQNVDAEMIKQKVLVAAKRIINGEKVLIILDDVWEELKLEEVGIPFGSDNKSCKILVTSRSKDVCEAMNVQKNVSVSPLQDEEAWTLFERVVGKSEWDSTLEEVALNIVKECGGLPLFIQAVGKALRNKEYKTWEAALDRLQDPTDEDALFKRNGIMQLKLSYDYLESEVARSCFLLCSMFPEDGTIGFKRLTYYCLGLGIFNNHDGDIQGAKYRVQLAVDSLKSSFLLLPGGETEDEELFKMHDLVRDMARLVTSKGDYKFWVESGRGLKKWQPKKYLESYNKISLMGNRICELHDHGLVFSHLDTFLIQDNHMFSLPDEFFQGMEKLKVLDMSCNRIPYLPQSLKKLTLLRMLDLSGNESLNEISILGKLTCLGILKLRKTRVTNIPKEIGELTNLRLLDVYLCESLTYVTPGVISKLNKLEELYVGLSKRDCNFLLELNESLKVLHLNVPELLCIPEGFHFETLMGFLIEEGYFENKPIYDCKRVLRLTESILPLTMRVTKLIQASECLILCYIKDLNNVLPYLYLEDCDKLKYIEVTACHDVRSLVKTCDMDVTHTSDGLGENKVFSQVEYILLDDLNRLELLWDRPLQYIYFCNLTSITIWRCPSLLNLFPLSIAQGLVNLRDIDIDNCKSLLVVISKGDEGTTRSETELVDTNIVFPLTNIKLLNLPKLESFYSGHSIIKYPYLENMMVIDCPNMKRWSYGENHIPNIRFKHEGRPHSNINEYINDHKSMDVNTIIRKGSFTNKDLFRADQVGD